MLSKQVLAVLAFLLLFTSCDTHESSSTLIGRFEVERDLLLAQFDSKTDVDDIHSIAAVATMLSDPRLSGVRYHAVAGAYGTQGGLYIPANELFEAAFGEHWSDAHAEFDRALVEVTIIAVNSLRRGGNIWIAEAGQSDFTAALIRNIKITLPRVDTKKRIHVIQHSRWNEGSTSPDNLDYVKENTSYNKIPDGNAIGNGTPGLRINTPLNWRQYITEPAILNVWDMAVKIANRYNGKDNRYKNEFVAGGGMDFSDVAETCWIFGFEYLVDTRQFFEEFASSP